MANAKKSKWIIGLTGTALSAFVISQVGANQPGSTGKTFEPVVTKSMSSEEKQYVQFDWSNFEINGVAVSGGVNSSERQTRRS